MVAAQAETTHPARRRTDRVTIAVFVAALALPMIAQALRLTDEAETLRFETQDRPPTLSLRPGALLRAPRELEQYYNKHFAFRGALTALHARLKIGLFGISSSDKVTIGKDGWLFYAGEEIVDQWRGARPFADDELATWARTLTARRDWLRARGIPYLFFIAPNPATLYPEEMPDALWRTSNPSRLDQLLEYLRSHTDVDTIDLRPALFEAKSLATVAYKTDTHWNQRGGFVAYLALQKWLRAQLPQWKTRTVDDYVEQDTPSWHGQLAFWLGAPEMFSETRPVLLPKFTSRVLTDGAPLPEDETADAWTYRPVVVRECADGEVGKAVFIRDSQFAAPAQFLTRHFRRSVLLWTSAFDGPTIEREKPDVVVEEMVERLLMRDPPRDPAPTQR